MNAAMRDILSLALALLLLAPGALGAARELIEEGNERFRAGEPEAALERYEAAREANLKALEALFNAGVAHAAIGDLDEAEQAFRRIDAAPDADPALAARARYNLGRLLADQAQPPGPEALMQGDVEQAFAEPIENLQTAAGFFRGALELDPADPEARRNLELTRKRLYELRKQREQMRQLQEQLRQLQQDLQQTAEQQEQEAQQNQQQSQQQQQGQQQQPDRQQQAQQNQQSLSERTEQLQERLEELTGQQQQQGQQVQQQQSPQQSMQQAREAQQRAEEQLQQGEQQRASQAQREAAERLREAAEQLQGQRQQGEGEESEEDQQEGEQEGEQQQQQQGQPQAGEQQQPRPGEGDEPTELERIVQWLLEREQERDAEQRARRFQPREREPVEQDW